VLGMNVNTHGNYSYSHLGELAQKILPTNQVDLDVHTNENEDVNPPEEQIPNEIIKVDSQSYVVKSFKTYNKYGKMVTL
jgi:hypothetical protein